MLMCTLHCLCAQVKCPSGVGCVAQASMCDGQQDCADGSDEAPAFCKKYDCALGQTVRLGALHQSQ